MAVPPSVVLFVWTPPGQSKCLLAARHEPGVPGAAPMTYVNGEGPAGYLYRNSEGPQERDKKCPVLVRDRWGRGRLPARQC